MGAGARSWELRTSSPERLAEAAAAACREVSRPTAGLVFVTGALAGSLVQVAERLSRAAPGVPLLVAAGSRVVTERVELADADAGVGVFWAGGRAEVVPLERDPEGGPAAALLRALPDLTGRSAPTVIALLRGEAVSLAELADLPDVRGTPHVIGGAAFGDPGVVAVDAAGQVTPGSALLLLRGSAAPAVACAESCRLLGDPAAITAARGSLVLELGGRPALEVLAETTASLPDSPLVLAAMFDDPAGTDPPSPPLLRPIRGVDPDRKGIVLPDLIRPGTRLSFAVHSSRVARDSLDAATRSLAREIAGAAPRFGLFFDDVLRSTEEHGIADADSRAFRGRFPGVPLAGLGTALELAPRRGRAAVHVGAGVFACFSAPS